MQIVRSGFMGETIDVYEEYPRRLDFDDGLPFDKRLNLLEKAIKETLSDEYENTQAWKDIKAKVRICSSDTTKRN